ncbi:hypothetical protein CTI12_AA179850 [Artemisia annua]|uniref:Uncharacterized protein n=1 Tax=Artemisia annua TaxID=35608 RepID=A0A2U1P970_ARTAN|nr:hypothetical protein CTI12_AA179850 [Artemisia annua]
MRRPRDYETMEKGCKTPKRSKITTTCPPAPRKKRRVYFKPRDPPENGYFQPPDLEDFFATGTCMCLS